MIINQLGQNVFCVGKWVSSQLLPLELNLSKSLPLEQDNITLAYTFYDVARRYNLKRGEIKDIIYEQTI